MRPEESDLAYLVDMLQYARRAVDLVSDRDFESYSEDSVVQLAVERTIEIVGEAARNVSRPFQEAHPEIPWRAIVAQRHILAHEYGEVQADRIFRVVTRYLPQLIGQLESVIPAPPSPED